MADTKTSVLAALTDLASNDLLPVVDVSDTSMGTGGTTKKVAANALPLPATKIVAPAGAGQYADYYTDGANDDVQIQAAIDAVEAAGGGKVLIKAGTYQISTDPVIDSDDIVIEGDGTSTVLKTKAATSANCLKVSGANNVTIRNIAIDGNKDNVNQLSIQYLLLNGIYITGSTNITVKNCYIHDHYAGGVLADSTDSLIIKNNIIKDGIDNGIFLRPDDSFDGCDKATISGNIVSGMDYSGIQAIGSDYLTISNNVSHSNGTTDGQGNGIGVEGCSFVSITGNTCYSNGVQGINIRYTDEVGEVSEASAHITVSGNVVYDHTSTNGDAGGIQVNAADDVTIGNNTVYGNAFGINITTGDSIDVTNLNINNNLVKNNTKNGIHISLSAADHLFLSNNQVMDNAEHALFTNVRVYVQGGIYKGSTGAGQGGIKFDAGADNSIIDGAYFYDNKDNGILVDGNTAGTLVRNCYFDNIDTSNQARALYEASGSGATTMLNCKVQNMQTEDYFFSHAQSRFLNDSEDSSNLLNVRYVRMKNTSGGALAEGDIVTLKAVAAGDEITTTTNQGDDLVFGMAAGAISNNAYGLIQVVGKTTSLKVDGTTDIAVGDFIGTFTTAKIGQKAASGDMAIAIALEAYSADDSSGVIDALLITPRKI